MKVPKFYSVDLRERVLQYLEKNKNREAASRLFQVGVATIYRWLSRKKEKGNIEPLRRAYVYKKIDDQKLIDYIEKNPDHFLSEIGKYFNLTPQAVFYALKRLKITRKKSSRSTAKGMKKKERAL
jgi:transposase